jgi:hypothetical protein
MCYTTPKVDPNRCEKCADGFIYYNSTNATCIQPWVLTDIENLTQTEVELTITVENKTIELDVKKDKLRNIKEHLQMDHAIWMWLLIGWIFSVIGFALYIWKLKRKIKQDNRD